MYLKSFPMIYVKNFILNCQLIFFPILFFSKEDTKLEISVIF